MSEGVKTYLSLDYKSSNLFEFSSTPKEGFEKNVSSTGKESYRKYYKYGVEGTLNNVSVRESNFGRQLSIALDEGIYLNFGIADQKGNVDSNTEQLIKVLPELNKGDAIKIAPYRFLPEGSKYDKSGITVSVNGEKVKGLTNAYYKDGVFVDGDVPAVKWVQDKLDKTKKKASLADLEKKNDYLLEVLAKEVERLKWVGAGSNAAPASVPQQEEDSLPF